MTKTFEEIIKGIRKAVLGIEVREDIAQGLEYVEQFAETCIAKAREAAQSAAQALQALKDTLAAKTEAVQAISTEKQAGLDAISTAKSNAVKETQSAHTAALHDISNARAGALDDVAASTKKATDAASAAAQKAEEASTNAADAQQAKNNAEAAAAAAGKSQTRAESAQKKAEDAADRAAAIVSTDKTLSVEGAPADAKATGDALADKLPLSGGTMTGPIIMPGGGSVLSINDNAATHNMVYRGKALGGSVTSKQWAAIKAGTFKDLYLGDYWSISGMNYIIAAFDYWYKCGDTACYTHHAVVISQSHLYTYKFNPTNTTEGGYVGSDLYKNGLTQAKQTVAAAFGSAHILNHREYLVNAVTNGAPTGTDWYDSTVELMNENMVYGSKQLSPMSDGTDPWNACRNHTIDKSQLPLFWLAPRMKFVRDQGCWLRDIASAARCAVSGGYGTSSVGSAGSTYGVWPVFGICG